MSSSSASSYRERLVPFIADDGFPCNLIHVTGGRTPTKGPVLLVHGAGVRANIFRPPERQTFVDALIEDGWDVWLENWRASIDLTPNQWTLDQAAVYDHPRAVQTVVAETGASKIKAVIHCQGSTSFMMSAVAGLVPEVEMILSNAVSLHPVVPFSAGMKHRLAVPLLARMTHYLDCQWGINSPTLLAKILTRMVRLTHWECDNIVCRYASFAYGLGFPTLWRHENLSNETHDWLSAEFGSVPLTFFKQIGKGIRAGHLKSTGAQSALPDDFGIAPPKTSARMAFFAGEDNRCFLPVSQERTFQYFDGIRPSFHSLRVIPQYAHLDVFIGKNAARDVFPTMIEELNS